MKPVLNHSEAVAEVYRLTPQIREYDEFMYMGVRWMPYTMFFQHPNYRSDVINTDSLGFRISDNDGALIGVDSLPETPVNLIVGGSTVLGTGATSDNCTLASSLSKIRDEPWLNFSCRGYNATQELLLFLMHRQRFSRIERVVVFSGINTLSLEGMPEKYASDHGRYYYSYEFLHYMEKYNEDLCRRSNKYASELTSGGSRLANKVRSFFESGVVNPADKIISDEDVPVNERVHRAVAAIIKALEEWKLLLAPFGAELVFALQPMASWTKEDLHPSEAAIFHAIDSCPNNFWRMFSRILGPEVHKQLSTEIEVECRRIGIQFIDMNTVIGSSKISYDNIFVDRVHFNDYGYFEVARLLNEAMKWQRSTEN